MLKCKKIISLFLILAVIMTFFMLGTTGASAAGTGIGLSEHCLNAYYSGWSYVYGAMSPGAVDCSGLIYMYSGTGSRVDMMGSSPETGSVSGGIPNIHGLGLYQPGHVGVYVGGGMAVDARSEYYGICYESVYSKSWTNWFKVAGVSYPTTGWELYNGNYYYYENGEYLTDTTITVGGVSYYLDSTGISSQAPGNPGDIADTPNSDSSTNTSSALKVGSSGDRVIELQYRLTELGFYNGDITGYFGTQTEAAYIRFQQAAGVYVDGIAGASDLEILYSDYAPTGTPAPTESKTESDTESSVATSPSTEENVEETAPSTFANGDYHDDIYKIQSELASLGYFNDDATGYYGELTEAAVTEFQTQNGLEATGEVDELTFATLFSSTALENPNPQQNANSQDDKVSSFVSAPENTAAPTNPTEVAMKSVNLASKALDGVSSSSSEIVTGSSRSTTFIVWLVIMVVFMASAFFFVFHAESKKKKARLARAKARANRNW